MLTSHHPILYWVFPHFNMIKEKIALSANLCKSAISRPNRNVQILYYERISANLLPGKKKLAGGLLICRNNLIHICNWHEFCQYH